MLAAEEIVAVMDGQCGVQRGDPAAEERRRLALVPFIGAGWRAARSRCARRDLAVHLWLAGEVRLRRIRENAAA